MLLNSLRVGVASRNETYIRFLRRGTKAQLSTAADGVQFKKHKCKSTSKVENDLGLLY